MPVRELGAHYANEVLPNHLTDFCEFTRNEVFTNSNKTGDVCIS